MVLLGLTDPVFMKWFKGSRTSYFVSRDNSSGCPKGTVIHTWWKLRTLKERLLYCNGKNEEGDWSVIEISRGPFRRRSAIYGPAAKNWRIAAIYRIMIEVDCIELQGGLNLPVNKAVQLINTYSSLQVMLDRIAELERELSVANMRRTELRAALKALLEVVDADRQKYRSRAAQHIRQFLEEVDVQATMMNEPNPSKDQIESWKKVAAITT